MKMRANLAKLGYMLVFSILLGYINLFPCNSWDQSAIQGLDESILKGFENIKYCTKNTVWS